MVNLKEKPFFLTQEQISWVENTIQAMTIEEKIGQLFVHLCPRKDEDYLSHLYDTTKIGGVRYTPAPGADVLRQNTILQKSSKLPMLIACNAEGGGDGVSVDGTPVGMPVKVGATDDPQYGYALGKVCGVEAEACGCNWLFSPIVDIHRNWRNPIISRRCFGNDADKVLAFSREFLRGVQENSSCICAAKHFPGDGVDERDQHLSRSVNSLSVEEWDKTFGKVYGGLIEAGLESVMVGHILQPAYSKALNPSLSDEEVLPATLSKELLQGLLRGKLNFNGLIVTDASHMVGITCEMKRRDMLPAAIAAGNDMFLFFNDYQEDFEYMMEGYQSGVITEERLTDALYRILGMKAKLSLTAPFDLPQDKLWKIGCEEHKQIAREVAEKSITLVKNKQDVFPVTPEKYRRILLVPAKALSGPNMFSVLGGPVKKTPAETFAELLMKEGFEVEIFESPFERIAKLPPEKRSGEMNIYFAAKTPVKDFVEKYDLVITLCNVQSYGQTAERVGWSMAKGGGEVPWYVHELPVVVASIASPFMLADVPQAKTYINAYAADDQTLQTLVEKLMGKSPFQGVDPVDSFCGMWDTRL